MTGKSFQTARFNCESLGKRYKRLYLWTFTLKHYTGSDEIGYAWKRIRQAAERVGLTNGLRVYEWHPGGHGLHIHVLTPDRVSARAMWCAVGHHYGRVDVQRVAAERVQYVLKYLFKGSARTEGLRMWATFGSASAAWRVKVRDVVVDSPFGEFCRESLKLCSVERAKQVGFRVYDLTRREACGVINWCREAWTGAALTRATRGGALAPRSLVTIRNNCTHAGAWPAWMACDWGLPC